MVDFYFLGFYDFAVNLKSYIDDTKIMFCYYLAFTLFANFTANRIYITIPTNWPHTFNYLE